MVSIIIPVYNVSKYIDKCMESVVNQTYKNIEIILINDGSTDGSEKKCEEWEIKDSRVKYISKENEGLGPTRNLGIKIAESEYIMFVDSDDWVNETIVEKLMNKIKDTNADMAVCDRYEVAEESNTYTIITQDLKEEMEVNSYPDIISRVSTSPCAKIYKKELFIVNKIEQPKHYYEDAVTLVLVALCKKICYVNEPLYYYVVDRGGSITNTIIGLDSLTEYLETAVDLFKKHNLFEKMNSNIMELCCRRVEWNMYRADKVLNRKLLEICKLNEQFIVKNWGEYELKKWKNLQVLESQFYVWGSYSLMISMKMLMRMNTPKFIEKHYSYSSIISAMNIDNGTLNNEIVVEHDNAFRRDHILKEIQREFANKNLGEFSDVKYLVLDFLDERFDIGECNGRYITISDAFETMKNSDNIVQKYYQRDDIELNKIWKESCLRYIELIRKYFDGKKIILVKLKLSEQYGDLDERYEFQNISEINKTNKILEKYYVFFANHCPEAVVIEVCDSQWFYTDKNYRHGCYPWHFNEYLYKEIKCKIEEVIWKK